MGWGKESVFKWSWSQHRALKYNQVCSNDDPRLTFDIFTPGSTLVSYAFVWKIT